MSSFSRMSFTSRLVRYVVTTRRPTSAPTRYCLDPCHVGALSRTRLYCLPRRIPAESRLPSDTSATGGVPAAGDQYYVNYALNFMLDFEIKLYYYGLYSVRQW